MSGCPSRFFQFYSYDSELLGRKQCVGKREMEILRVIDKVLNFDILY